MKTIDEILIIGDKKVFAPTACPFWDCRVPVDWMEKGKKILIDYCKHPLIGDEEILCKYGLTEIRVPENCPLKKSMLTIGVNTREE